MKRNRYVCHLPFIYTYIYPFTIIYTMFSFGLAFTKFIKPRLIWHTMYLLWEQEDDNVTLVLSYISFSDLILGSWSPWYWDLLNHILYLSYSHLSNWNIFFKNCNNYWKNFDQMYIIKRHKICINFGFSVHWLFL